VSLAKARARRDDARRLIADNADPGVAKHAEKTSGADTFRVIAIEWLSKQNLARATLDKATWIFEQLLFPELGDRPIRVISAPDLLAVLRKIEGRGAVETAHRAKQRASQVFRYAIAIGRASHDRAADLRGALTAKDVEHRAAITEPKRVGELLRDRRVRRTAVDALRFEACSLRVCATWRTTCCGVVGV
jgi:integrase